MTFEDLEARTFVHAIYSLTRTGDHLPEKIQFYDVARGSAGKVHSLLYVAEDNFNEASAEAKRLRGATNDIGRVITDLLGSTNRRRDSSAKGAILALFGPISYLLSARFFQPR